MSSLQLDIGHKNIQVWYTYLSYFKLLDGLLEKPRKYLKSVQL